MIITITIVVTLLIIGCYLIKNKKDIVSSEQPLDNAPVAYDNLIRVYGASGYEITKEDLLYSDVDGDDVNRVRFYGDIESLYHNKEFTNRYMYKEVLPIDFKLYLQFKNKDEYKIKYDVSSNNYWSV